MINGYKDDNNSLKKNVFCVILGYKRALIQEFIDYHICYKCVLQLSKKIDTIFSESKDYETSEAVDRSLSFIGQDHKASEYIIHLLSEIPSKR